MADRARIAPRLIVFSDTTRSAPELMLIRFCRLAEGARPQSVLFTLRDYDLPLRVRLALGLELATLARRTEQLFGLAERADVARALAAKALHLPENGLSERDARRYLGEGAFISRACHDPLRALDAGPDAVLLSPIFAARKGRPALGIGALRRVRDGRSGSSNEPALYALGGVDAGNAAACLTAGVAGVAVIGAAVAANQEGLLDALEIKRQRALRST